MKHFTVEDGLPSSHVYMAYQDSDGFMWFGTDKGVAKFDGYNFKIFTVNDSLPSNDVWRVEEDNQGRLWLSTYNELAYILNDSVFSLSVPDRFHMAGNIDHYFFESGKSHYFRAEPSEALFELLPGDSIIEHSIPKSLRRGRPTEQLIPMGRDEKGNKWFCGRLFADNSMNLYKEKKGVKNIFKSEKLSSEDFISGNNIRVVRNPGSNMVFISTRSRIYQFDFNELTRKKVSEIFDSNIKTEIILSHPPDKIRFETTEGHFITDSELNILPEYRFLQKTNLNTLFEDRGGNLWISTANGVFFQSGNARTSQTYTFFEKEENNDIQTIIDYEGNKKLLGTGKGKVLIFEEGQPTSVLNIEMDNIPFVKKVKKLMILNTGDILTGVDGGIINLTPTELKNGYVNRFRTGPEGIHSFHLGDYYKFGKGAFKDIANKNDTLFAAAGTRGVRLLTKRGFLYLPEHPFRGERTYSVLFDEEENIWMGRKSGLFFQSKTNGYSEDEVFMGFDKPVNDMTFGEHGEIWIGTDGFGLFRFFEGNFEAVPGTEGDINNSILIDGKDKIWLTTNKGVRKLQIKNKNPFEYSVQNITTAQGLASNEVNYIFKTGSKIYVGTKKGLTVLDENALDTQFEPPLLRINKVIVNGENRDFSEGLRLRYFENNIDIEYVCLSFKSAKNIVYEYKMEGIDTFWHSTTDLHREYPVLPPNEYKFSLRARDIDGMESPELSFEIVISPPWWQTLTARIAGALAVILTGFLIVQNRIRQIKRKAEEETKINKKFAELELQALQAQMNPHFVFNALHAIQDFIFNKDERAASKYLVKFSRLMRLFLESSKEKYILLSDEIQLLNLYIELEKLRFEDKFDYEFTTDDNIDPSSFEIPSMLIQPFIENAINHGLLYKKTPGKLTVRFEWVGEFLICTILDDGIGREKAAEIKNQSVKSYKSRGMSIVKERQKILNFIEDSDVDIDIEDLKDKNGNAIGTRVEIRIPTNQ